MVKVLVTGSEGILGQALMRNMKSKNISAEGADIRAKRNKVDIADKDGINGLIKDLKPSVVVHAAATTDVDNCEIEREKTYLVNTDGTKNVTEACKITKSFLIYISTDYVFDGTKKAPYKEDDTPNPINVYGDSKLQGEYFIQKLLDSYLIIRTSWLFGKGGKNFVDTIIKKTETEKKLKVVDDQRGSPTYAEDLAGAITELLPKAKNLQPITLNITNSDSCTWYEFAKEILRIKGFSQIVVEPATSDAIDRPAKRPRMSVLDNSKFEKLYGKKLPSWQDGLKRYIKGT